MSDYPFVLGRHQEHDPASKAFPAAISPARHTTDWAYHGTVLDQGQIGACTGNAAVDVLMTGPYYDHLKKIFTEVDALAIYERATVLDGVPGSYPPNDTGSSGIAVMKACVERSWIRRYNHAFGIDHAIGALMLGPVLTGVAWYQGMFTPDAQGFVHPTGQIVGGHEFAVIGYDVIKDAVHCLNSWGTGWGLGGYFWIKTSDYASLLAGGGDVCVPIS